MWGFGFRVDRPENEGNTQEEGLGGVVVHKCLHACSGFRVRDSGFRVQGSGFRVQGADFRVQGLGFRVQGSGFRVWG